MAIPPLGYSNNDRALKRPRNHPACERLRNLSAAAFHLENTLTDAKHSIAERDRLKTTSTVGQLEKNRALAERVSHWAEALLFDHKYKGQEKRTVITDLRAFIKTFPNWEIIGCRQRI